MANAVVMAHFAEVDENNIVLQVLVIDNDMMTVDGVEVEQAGIDYLNDLLPDSGQWIQTSYNGNLRGYYAGPGMEYMPSLDVFTNPQPYPSWIFNGPTFSWIAPTPQPSVGHIWDEDTVSWVKPASPYPSWVWSDDHWDSPVERPADGSEEKPYAWDEDTTSWVEVE